MTHLNPLIKRFYNCCCLLFFLMSFGLLDLEGQTVYSVIEDEGTFKIKDVDDYNATLRWENLIAPSEYRNSSIPASSQCLCDEPDNSGDFAREVSLVLTSRGIKKLEGSISQYPSTFELDLADP